MHPQRSDHAAAQRSSASAIPSPGLGRSQVGGPDEYPKPKKSGSGERNHDAAAFPKLHENCGDDQRLRSRNKQRNDGVKVAERLI
jgi:hypothetical protein